MCNEILYLKKGTFLVKNRSLKHIGMKSLFVKLLLILTSFSFYENATAQSDCEEKKVGRTYYSICSNNIVTEKKKLFLTTKAVMKKTDNKTTYKVVHYYVSDRKKNSTDEVFLEYSKFINNLEKLEFHINGKPFTGILKIALPFINEGTGTSYNGYDVLIVEFVDGKFVSKSKLIDIDLEKEQQIVRPS